MVIPAVARGRTKVWREVGPRDLAVMRPSPPVAAGRTPGGLTRRPWVGLLVAGVVLWGLYRLSRSSEPELITVPADAVAAMVEGFMADHGRPPDTAERQALVETWAEREMLVREARAQGLDRGDPIVRRRLVQAMRFTLEEAEPTGDPGGAVLTAWYEAHAERYRRPARRGFEQVFVAAPGGEAEAEALRRRLLAGEEPGALGDAWAHGRRQPPAGHAALAGRYGEAFARGIEAAPRDRWVTLRSELGWHVVRVDDQRPGHLPPLDEIRARVLADWRVEQRAANLERGLQGLRGRYRVQEGP